MSVLEKTSEAAFPSARLDQYGMSLRDYFAGQVIAGIMANPDISASSARCGVTVDEYRRDTARSSYAMADAMIAERSRAAS